MKKKLPLVSIVIPTYNSAHFISKCLDSVFKTNYKKYEVIIVDDCSSDDTLNLVGKFRDKENLQVLRNPKRKLAAASRNKGFKVARGQFVALLDHDVEVHPNWISEMVKVIEKDKEVGIVQSKVFDINRRKILQCVGVRIIPHLGWVESIGFGQKDKGQYNEVRGIVGGATGVMYRKKAFVKVGGFDEKLGINLDDLDLNWRMWIAGYKTVVAPKAITFHWSKKQKTRDKWIKRIFWEFHYAKMPRVFLKNYEFINAIKSLSTFLIVASLRGIFNLFFRLNPAPLIGLMMSLFWNAYYLPQTFLERKLIQGKLRKIPDKELFQTGIFINKSLFRIFKEIWLPVAKGKDLSTEEIGKEKKLRCLFCERGNFSFLRKIEVKPGFTYILCDKCGGGRLYPQPTKRQLKKIYDSCDYFNSLSAPASNKVFQWFLTKRVYQSPSEWVTKLFRPGRILDVGCGNGEFLADLRNYGFETWGCDISRVAVLRTQEKIGKSKVKMGFLPDLNFRIKFDIISFWHILEHLDNPFSYLLRARSLLKKGGLIVGEVPNLDSSLLKIFGSYYCWVIVPEHLVYFSRESLRALLKRIGFKRVKFYKTPRGLLNFSMSLNKLLFEKNTPSFIRKSVFVFSIPFSILLILIFTLIGRGEVLRFSAQK